jgi:hypothetical protein
MIEMRPLHEGQKQGLGSLMQNKEIDKNKQGLVNIKQENKR